MEIKSLWDLLLTTSIIIGCVLLVLWGLLLLAGSFRRKKTTKEKKPEPAKKIVITDHHPATGDGHGHGHDDHHGHGGGGLLKWGLAILVLGLVGWFLVWPWLKGLGFGQVPGASAEVRYAMAPQGTIPGRDARSASAVAYVRHPLRAPAKSQDWSGWVSIPSGYRPLVCEADSSLACTDTESDVTKIGYVYQCQDLRGETHDWTPGACEHLVAFRVKAKGDRALNLAYWLEPF